ncbi:PF08878 domain protein [Leptospira fainei serovar Hurstbridge str. BUT 6]|uniref:PF08878 domain protein n=1 Tax=Leptospira fainei serovar Hurstbridge str. BUT 6 TaxID=1193011 RepID=S3W3A2_9LEPT|nr:Hachiman antiphage defense system protein HamA [Leptospira fainei]EPG74767.1 PF08878 domain protein [Leptospira fainei serovar Hurstbridge str. BUT 6]
MDIYKKFTKKIINDYVRFEIDRSEWVNVKDYIKSHGKEFYLKEDELPRFSKKSADERKKYLANNVLPSKGKIRSGDFGEIFSFFFIQSEYTSKKIDLYGPKKWRWKEHPDSPAPFSDVIFLFAKDPMNPHSNDLAISIESKMNATKPSKKKNRIQEALDGAEKDRFTRFAQTINWVETKYEREDIQSDLPLVRRFKDPVNYPYRQEYYAIAIFDIGYIDSEISKGYTKPSNEIKLYLLSINDLKKLYETYFQELINEA